MRVTRYLQVAFVLTAFVTLGACSSMGGHHQDQDGGVAYASVTWDSGPLDRDYQVQLTDMENRHNQEAAHPRQGESSDQMTQRQTAERLARAFGFGYVIRDTTDGLGGTTSAAAAAAGIPAVTAEAGGCGLLEAAEVERHVSGLHNALRAIGMLPGEPEPPPASQRLVERFVWLRSATAGWWQADVGAGDEVAAGDRVGAVLDPFGDLLKTITAPEPGVVLFLTTSPAVAENGLLLGLGGGMQPYE